MVICQPAANWTFNNFIQISTLTSFGWALVILLLAIFLVSVFLMTAYTFVSNIRLILNGLSGLEFPAGSRNLHRNLDHDDQD